MLEFHSWRDGRVFKAPVLKTGVGVRPPWVQSLSLRLKSVQTLTP